MMNNINWYPGHMKKTGEMIRDNLKLIDAIIEVVDARIPKSGRNPEIKRLIGEKPEIVVLSKTDLADPFETEKWNAFFRENDLMSVDINAMSGAGMDALYSILKNTGYSFAKNGKNRPLRIMVAGVPNSGKSSLINRMTGRKSAQTGDRPGITRGKQWLTLSNGMQLLDTPGILWPKFEDPEVGLKLAYCGSIKEEILDVEDLALSFVEMMHKEYPGLLLKRYRLDGLGTTPLETLDAIALKRGFILPGKKIDYLRCARTVMDEFRSGKIGKITLEKAGQGRNWAL